MHCGVLEHRGFELDHTGSFASSPWAAAVLAGHHHSAAAAAAAAAVGGGSGMMQEHHGYPHPGAAHAHHPHPAATAAMPMDLHVPQGFPYYRLVEKFVNSEYQVCNKLTLNEILEVLESDDITEASVYISAPENHLLSDEDSDDDERALGDINRLTGNQLRGEGELQASKIISNGIEDIVLPADEAVASGTASCSLPNHADDKLFRDRIRKWVKRDITPLGERTWEQPQWLQRDWSPVELFELFYDDEIIDLFTEMSKIYAIFKGNSTFEVSRNEMKTFFSVLLLSGYSGTSRYRLLWDTGIDTHHPGVARALSRNRFEELLRYLHVCNNNDLPKQDKFAKVRPLWSMINERWLKFFPQDANLCVDESMIPYYGHHSTKQHLHGKPIRFGFKVWSLCTRLGYLIQAEPYQGANTAKDIPELGVGGSVVIDLLQELPNGKNYSLYMDNYFTSLKLLQALGDMGHDATGTIRNNRIEKAPLTDPSKMKKMQRGAYDQVTDENSGITIVRYNDNIVTVASNKQGVTPIGRSRRWSMAEKKKIEVLQPACISQYNTYMGGVDRLDQNISCYRVQIRMKKWYWQLLMFPLNASMNNAYQLYRLTPSGKSKQHLDYLAFIRVVVQTYMGFSPERKIGRSPKCVKKRVPENTRLDGRDHIIIKSDTQVRCGECHKNTLKKCKKCNVGCHANCFEKFHS